MQTECYRNAPHSPNSATRFGKFNQQSMIIDEALKRVTYLWPTEKIGRPTSWEASSFASDNPEVRRISKQALNLS